MICCCLVLSLTWQLHQCNGTAVIVSPSAIGTWFLFCQPLLACFSHCMGTVLDFRVVHIVLICGTVLASELCKFSCLRGFVSKICLRNCILCSVFHSLCSCVHFAVFQVSVAGVLAGSEKYAPKTVLSVLCSILSFCFVCSVTLFMFMLPGFSRVCCTTGVVAGLPINHFPATEAVQFGWAEHWLLQWAT